MMCRSLDSGWGDRLHATPARPTDNEIIHLVERWSNLVTEVTYHCNAYSESSAEKRARRDDAYDAISAALAARDAFQRASVIEAVTALGSKIREATDAVRHDHANTGESFGRTECFCGEWFDDDDWFAHFDAKFNEAVETVITDAAKGMS